MPSPTPTPSPHSEHIASVMARTARKAPDDGEAFSAVAQLLRGYDAALIAAHTAELTARLHVTGVRCEEAEAELARWKLHAENQERRVEALQAELTAMIAELEAEAVKGEQAAAERIVQLEGKVRWLEAAQREVGDRNAHLEAQLTASAQREASARAEAIRECIEKVRQLLRDTGKTYDGFIEEAQSRGYDADVIRGHRREKDGSGLALATAELELEKLLTSPPPRVDAWIPVESRQWKHGAVMWGYDRFYEKTGEVYFDGKRKLDNGTVGRFIFADGDDDCDIVLVHELPYVPDYPPPTDDGFAKATEAEHGETLRKLLAGPVTLESLKRVRLLHGVFTSCPACSAEPWVNIDCKVCAVMSSLPEPPAHQPAAGTEGESDG